MNILIANWTWYPSGGDWTYIENLINLYKRNNHKIIPFSMKDDRNFPTEYSEYFINNINYKKLNENKQLKNGIKVLTKSIYSLEASNNLEKLLATVKIDLAHINVIHHYITPSILKILKQRGIPIIWTLHDYTILCPETTFVSNGKICEKCKGGDFFNCIINKCKKKSYLASTVAALENYLYKYLDYYAYVDYFICPSVFLYEKYSSYGFFKEKLIQLYHGYDFGGIEFSKRIEQKSEDQKYIVFVGRLEKLKGVYTILDAMKSNPTINLKIIGDGPEEKELKKIKDNDNLFNVDFLGKRKKEEVWELVHKAEFLVCPSEWYEVLGFTIIEAMLIGKPVIGSNIGAIPETVIEGLTGMLFEPGNSKELSEKINSLYHNPALIMEMGGNAKSHVNNLIDPDKYFTGLKKIVPNL